MKKLKYTGFVLLLGLVILAVSLSIPTNYEVEAFTPRHGTKYWEIQKGVKIGYTKVETSNLEKREPIIYLHGGPGGKITDEIIDVLRPLSNQGHDLYFYDQVGSGHSSRLKNIKDYSVGTHREHLKSIIDIIACDKITIIGHSWGACLAINFLQKYPDKVHKLILTGPGPILPINRNLSNENPPDSLNLMEPAYSNQEGNKKIYTWRSKIILKWAYLFNSKLASDKEVDDFFTKLNQELNKSTECNYQNQDRFEGGGGYYSHIMTMKSISKVNDKRDYLQNMNTPILILRGQCDNQKWAYTKEYLDLFKNSSLKIIGGVGHNIIKNKEIEYYTLLSEFIRDY